jgi:hypothetical protein
LKEKVAAPAKKNLNYRRRADYETPLYPQKLALTSPTSGGHSVSIVRSRTKATELLPLLLLLLLLLFILQINYAMYGYVDSTSASNNSPLNVTSLYQSRVTNFSTQFETFRQMYSKS